MRDARERPAPARILLPRLDMIGDLVLAEGVLEALRDAFPAAELCLLVRRGLAELAPLFPDGVTWLTTEVDPYRDEGSGSDPGLGRRLVADLGGARFDLVVATTFSRSWADDVVAAASRAPRRVAFAPAEPGTGAPRPLLDALGLSGAAPFETLVTVDEQLPEVEKYGALLGALGLPARAPRPRLRVPPALGLEARDVAAGAGLDAAGFLVCAPGGTRNVPIKRWPPSRFAEVVAAVERGRRLRALVVGDAADAAAVEETVSRSRALGATPASWLGQPGDLPLLAALLSSAALFVGMDSGPMHLAAALGTPVVGVFGGGTWPRFVPATAAGAAVVREMDCFGCRWECAFGDAPCLGLVGADDVLAGVEAALGPAPADGACRVVRGEAPLADVADRLVRGAASTAERARDVLRGIDADRSERLEASRRLSAELKVVEEDRERRLADVFRLNEAAARLEDEVARLGGEVTRLDGDVRALRGQLEASEADRAERLRDIEGLCEWLEASEADRAERLRVIETLSAHLEASEADRAERLRVIETLAAEKALLETGIAALRGELELREGFLRSRFVHRLWDLYRRRLEREKASGRAAAAGGTPPS